jgi:GMP synthase (glutamine-hydrolysing)
VRSHDHRPTILVALATDSEPLGLLEAPLHEAGLGVERWYPAATPPRPPLGRYAGVIALGGAANPDEDARHPWLADERAVLAEAARRDLPVLGVCLGAELLAQALGGRSERLAVPEIGWVEVSRAPGAEDDPLLGAVPARFRSFEWHGFGFDPGPGGVVLAATGPRPQAFRAGRAWGLQFHPEADEAIIAGWARHAPGELRSAGVEPAWLAAESARHMGEQRRLARALGRAFAGVVAGASGRRPAARSPRPAG